MIRGYCYAYFADNAFGQPFVTGYFFPCVAAVGGLEEPRARSAARHVPGPAARLPDGRIENARIDGIQREIDGAGGVGPEQHFLPRLAAVFGPEHAALRIGPECVAEYGDVDAIGVGRMDADGAGLAGVREPDVGPRLAGVGGFVDAVPRRH